MNDANNDVVFTNDFQGTRAVVKNAWSDSIEKTILANKADTLELNTAFGWYGTNVDFLSRLTELKSIIIIDYQIKSIAPINELHNLLAITVQTACKTAIDFANFPEIKRCSLMWRPAAKSLFASRSLQYLFIDHYHGADMMAFEGLENLEELGLKTAPMNTLSGIEFLTKLRRLRLANFRNLQSLVGIGKLKRLESLSIQGCYKFGNITELSGLSNLIDLELSDNGIIESLAPIETLRKLHKITFTGTTTVRDGDMTPLLRTPSLLTAFGARKHYSHSPETIDPIRLRRPKKGEIAEIMRRAMRDSIV